MISDFLVPRKIEKWSEGWPILSKLNSSVYADILNSVFDRLDPSILYQSQTHGQGHIERAMLFGALICMNESVDPELAKDIVNCCALHDIGRIDDRYDEAHGSRSAKKLMELGLDARFLHPAEACAAIHAHSIPDSRMFTVPELYGVDNIDIFTLFAKCLKDADNLDRVRIYDLDTSHLRYESTVDMVPLAYYVLNEFEYVPSVLCYGDSNTYGYNPVTGDRYPVHMRWPNILQHLLGTDYEVIAEGMNGRTTAFAKDEEWKSGINTLESVLYSHYPVDHLVFMLGTNDCAVKYGLKAENIANGMERLVICSKSLLFQLQGYEPQIIIIAPRSLDEKILHGPFRENENEGTLAESAKLPALYQKIAEKYGCGYISLEDVLELSPADGLHLQAFGGKKIAERVAGLILGDPLGNR